MSSYNPLIMEIAAAHKGLHEWPGAKHNPEVVALFKAVGHGWVADDETPWCAAFVGAVLGEAGLPHTGKLNARSYEDYGVEVTTREVQPGDIVVFWRGSPTGWQGHVAFFVRFDGAKVIVRGGNQGNRVTDSPYPISRVLSYRRAAPADMTSNRPTLKEGSVGMFVRALQDRLRDLRYFPGKTDGNFGERTDAAVRAFQNAYDLKVDGVVGRETWEELDKAVPRPERAVTKETLREDGSRTMSLTATLKKIGASIGGMSLAGVPLKEAIATAPTELETASTALDATKAFVIEYWWLGLVMLAIGAVWWVANRMEDVRLEDAKSGAHLGK